MKHTVSAILLFSICFINSSFFDVDIIIAQVFEFVKDFSKNFSKKIATCFDVILSEVRKSNN